jgi:hypothetical protein
MITFNEFVHPTVKTRFRDEQGNLLVKEGDVVAWNTLGGDSYRGKIVEMDSNVAYVELEDGQIKTIEC